MIGDIDLFVFQRSFQSTLFRPFSNAKVLYVRNGCLWLTFNFRHYLLIFA